jgi:hypothetical protein
VIVVVVIVMGLVIIVVHGEKDENLDLWCALHTFAIHY